MCRTAARALGPRRIAAHVVTSSREPPSAKMPPGFDQVGLVMGERTPQTRTSKTATAKAFCELVRGKIVVVDVSCLLYSLLLRKPGLAHLILSVDPTSSVYYEVCRLMSAWFRSQLLFHAKAVVFVFDPTYVRGGFHCDACRGVYDEHIAIKYRITGRTKKQTKAAAEAAKWVAESRGIVST